MQVAFGVAGCYIGLFVFNIFRSSENMFATPEVDARGSDIVQAFVITLVLIMIYQANNLLPQFAWQVIVFEKNTTPDGPRQ